FCRPIRYCKFDSRHPLQAPILNHRVGAFCVPGTVFATAWTEETSRSEMVSPGEWPKVSPCRSESLSGHAEDHFWAAERCNDAKVFKPVRKTSRRFGLSEFFVI